MPQPFSLYVYMLLSSQTYLLKEVDMSWWICSECDYVVEADTPPELCPGCHKKCASSDVTCYIPECGGPGNLDRKLVAIKAREAKKQIR